jgi:hypothetical protein
LKVAHHPKPTPSRYAMGTSQTMHGLDFLLEHSSMFICLAKFIMLRHHHHHQNSSAYINVLDPKTRHMINVYHAHLQMSNMYDLGRFTAAGQEMFGDQCYKKCSLLSPQYPYRVRAPGSPMLGLFWRWGCLKVTGNTFKIFSGLPQNGCFFFSGKMMRNHQVW